MSSRPLVKPFDVIVNGDMSGNITSKVSIIDDLSMISYGVSWAGTTPIGTISVQASNDYSQNVDGSVRNAGTWNTLTLSAVPAVTGNTGNGMIDIDSLAGYAVRLVYNFTSGTGLMQVKVACKVA